MNLRPRWRGWGWRLREPWAAIRGAMGGKRAERLGPGPSDRSSQDGRTAGSSDHPSNRDGRVAGRGAAIGREGRRDDLPAERRARGGEAGGRVARRARRRGDGRRDAVHPAFSRNALFHAWRKVRAAGGGAGVDGEDIAAFERKLDERLAALAEELAAGTYRPRPVRRVYVPKPGSGLRPLALWALRDRVAQRAMHDYLEPFFEPRFLDCSHGYRPGRSVETAVRAVVAAREEGRRWLLDADIEDCFDRIDAARLMTFVRARVDDAVVLRMIESWLGMDVLGSDGRARPAGVSQGGVLSPLLCNIYLHAFDVEVTGRGVRLVRYADDLVCLCRRRREAEAAREVVATALGRLGLALNARKTGVTRFDDGFKFLGVFFLGDAHYPLSR